MASITAHTITASAGFLRSLSDEALRAFALDQSQPRDERDDAWVILGARQRAENFARGW